MLKVALRIVAVLIALCSFSRACSMASCVGSGIELRPNFRVLITHNDRPLAGAVIKVWIYSENTSGNETSLSTNSDGLAAFSALKPGNYWLEASYLGIGAGYECFHIAEHPSRKAKSKLEYSWGNSGYYAVRRVAGRLFSSRPGTGGNVIWNMTHPVKTPIANSTVKLQNAASGVSSEQHSTSDGAFAFDPVPPGIYVLHAGFPEGGSTDHLILVSPSAEYDYFFLTETLAGGGSCGGFSFSFEQQPSRTP